ncbi:MULTISPECIES: hypothetical protein [unclassified Pseudomonas]|uniref:hypothetical protein n=1 Tax=Pseudomonas TaxID=286 RepID=UPI001483964F|nr:MULTISPECIES: hypothetical protein [unclassified Pseudomonas]
MRGLSRDLTWSLGKKQAEKVAFAGYERWLMIVDESGAVTKIVKLDENAKFIGEVIQ